MEKIYVKLLVLAVWLVPCAFSADSKPSDDKLASPSGQSVAYYAELASVLPKGTVERARQKNCHDFVLNRAVEKKVAKNRFSSFYVSESSSCASAIDRFDSVSADADDEPKAVVARYGQAALRSGVSCQTLVFAGVARQRLMEYDAALKDFNRALLMDKDCLAGLAYLSRGYLYRDMKSDKQAFDDFNRAVEVNPGLSRAWYALSSFHLEKGNFNESSHAMNRFFQNSSDAEDRAAAASGIECEELVAMGYNVAGCAQVIVSTPTNVLRPAGAAEPEPEIARAAAAEKVDNEAAIYFQKAFLYASEKAEQSGEKSAASRASFIINEGARAETSLRDVRAGLEAAVSLYSAAIAVEPLPEAYLRRGSARLKMALLSPGKTDMALVNQSVKDFTSAASGANRGWALKMRATAEFYAGDKKQSAETFASALKESPSPACFLSDRAYFSALAGDLKTASEDLEKFFSMAGNSPQSEAEISSDTCAMIALSGIKVSKCRDKEYFRQIQPVPHKICYPY